MSHAQGVLFLIVSSTASPSLACKTSFALSAYAMIASDSVAADPRISEPEAEKAPPSPSVARSPVVRLDDVFNFQVVVFQVEDVIFEVLKSGFNVPGTIFEEMFALPQPTPAGGDASSVEGNSRDNPIVLPGVSENDFRIFLRVLYPFMSRSEVTGYEEWIPVLRLATMWGFQTIRTTAIGHLSGFFSTKSAAEKLSIGREYKVADWVKDGYKALCQEPPETLEEMKRPNEPFGLDWETIARILFIREKMRRQYQGGHHCGNCDMHFGTHHSTLACPCRYETMIKEDFSGELSTMNGIDA
ncbi:hypothetical protein D9613_001092 [Agrocybe pediades]|uniref:BTB domain-containing protein n=1 Tax=Agrocybe pediades TaxID=84607 RepID=A0A8H4VUZ4_9AGAR|nr:hypothetical protein D9613_001092 [Agrocybe pediades]